MNKLLALVLTLTFVGCSAATPEKDNLGYQGKNSESIAVEELLVQLQSNPEVKIRIEQGWRIAEVSKEHALYSFVPENHPANPSYVKREVVEKDGSVYIKTSVMCGAEKYACDQLMKDFMELNNKIKDRMQGGA